MTLRPAGRGSALIREVIRRVGRLESIDPVAVRCTTLVHRVIRGRTLKNLVSGTWLGHPLHPLLTDLPIGCWSSAVVVEGVGGRDAADALVAVGVLTALPTAVTGFADWSDTDGEDRRVGLAHAAAVTASLSLFATSLVAARTGHRRAGAVLRLGGLTAVTAGGYLGGHLTFARGVGVDHTVFDEGPARWTGVAPERAVREGRLVGAEVDGYGVLLYRRNGHVHTLADRCSHAGAMLSDGEVDGDLCVVCPLHRSRFRLEDGSVVDGPATAPQTTLETRILDGQVEVRVRSTGG